MCDLSAVEQTPSKDNTNYLLCLGGDCHPILQVILV